MFCYQDLWLINIKLTIFNPLNHYQLDINELNYSININD
jgi:hypothetical protein